MNSYQPDPEGAEVRLACASMVATIDAMKEGEDIIGNSRRTGHRRSVPGCLVHGEAEVDASARLAIDPVSVVCRRLLHFQPASR